MNRVKVHLPYAPRKQIKNKYLALIFNVLVLFYVLTFATLLKIVCIMCDQLLVTRATNPYVTFMCYNYLI